MQRKILRMLKLSGMRLGLLKGTDISTDYIDCVDEEMMKQQRCAGENIDIL